MLKVPAAFRGIERPNERSDTEQVRPDLAALERDENALRPAHHGTTFFVGILA